MPPTPAGLALARLTGRKQAGLGTKLPAGSLGCQPEVWGARGSTVPPVFAQVSWTDQPGAWGAVAA